MRHSIFYLGRLTAEKNLFSLYKSSFTISVLSNASQLQYLSRFEVQLAKREFLFKRFLDLHYKEIQVLILMNENNS